jgi:sacsin
MSSGFSSSAAAAPPPPPSPREHVERIRRERYFIGRGERNPLAEDMHQAVNYLSQELYSKDVHFLMELIQVCIAHFITVFAKMETSGDILFCVAMLVCSK